MIISDQKQSEVIRTVYTTLVTNTGYTLKWTNDESKKPLLTGGVLASKYNLVEFHLHWGGDNCRGSEHTIDGNRSVLY